MDTFDLEKEQERLAKRVELRDGFSTLSTIGGADFFPLDDKLVACVTVCSFPEMKLLEQKTYLLNHPLPYKPGFLAYRVLPALVEAYNLLEQEPELLLVNGLGINHPLRLGLASHLGLVLNIPTIGIAQKLFVGEVKGNQILYQNEICGFELKTRDHALPLYVSPGNLVALGSVPSLVQKTVLPPHKLPEPLHLARKYAKKAAKLLLKPSNP